MTLSSRSIAHAPAVMATPLRWLLSIAIVLGLVLGAPAVSHATPVAPPVAAPVPATVAPLSLAPAPTSVPPAGVSSSSAPSSDFMLADTGKKKKKKHYKIVWRTHVSNHGGQRAVDRCRGGLTRWHTKLYGKTYYPIHNYCGGSKILHLKKGQVIKIGKKKYKVVSIRKVRRGAKASAIRGMKGSALLQTCYWGSSKMRVVGVKRV